LSVNIFLRTSAATCSPPTNQTLEIVAQFVERVAETIG
jgi:hypothetical protein